MVAVKKQYPEGENATSKYRKQLEELKQEYNDWRPHYKEISQFQLPRAGRYLDSDKDISQTNDGSKKHQRIINGTAGEAIKIIASGLMGGLTSPSRPWFRLALSDKDLMDFGPVKEYLQVVRDRLLCVFARSNFYTSSAKLYKELPVFGTAPMFIKEDFESVIRCRPFTVGEYYLMLDASYRVVGMYRQYELKARQILEYFGNGEDNPQNISDVVKEAAKNKTEHSYTIVHCVKPSSDYNSQIHLPESKKYESVYYEDKSDGEKILKREGFDYQPFVAPRWEVVGVDTYGNSLGMEVLGDVKMLQKLEEKKLKALDKLIDPPLNADPSLKTKGATIIPGGVNYVDTSQGKAGLTPVYQINPDMAAISIEIQNVERRIRSGYFNDLFLSIIGREKTMTATEVAEVHEEKFLVLGPVLESLSTEFHDPAIDIAYIKANEFGILPPPPEELQGIDINIEHISILAQAQKLVSRSTVQQTVGFVASLAEVNPDILDVINFDEAAEEYAELTGTPPKIIRGREEREGMRQQRAQAAQEAKRDQDAIDAAGTAKTLSETQSSGSSALDALSGL